MKAIIVLFAVATMLASSGAFAASGNCMVVSGGQMTVICDGVVTQTSDVGPFPDIFTVASKAMKLLQLKGYVVVSTTNVSSGDATLVWTLQK